MEFQQRQSIDEQTNPEGESAVVGDKVLIARYHFIKVPEGLKSRRKRVEHGEESRTAAGGPCEFAALETSLAAAVRRR